MAKNWYTLQVYAGYEKKVLGEIKRLLENNELDSSVVSDVKVLTEETVENKKGKKVVKTSILVAGYIFLEMDLPQFGWKDTCNKIRHVHGVNGFVGTKPSERPRAIPKTTVSTVAKTGFTISFFQPDLISFAVCPGSSQNSWNIKRARRVAVSRDVRQNAEYVRTSKV